MLSSVENPFIRINKNKVRSPEGERHFIMKPKKITYVLIFAAIFVAVVLFFLNGSRGTVKYYKSYQEKSKLEQEIQHLEEENARLKDEKEQLESDPAYIEKTAREKYTMKKEGEKVYKVQHKK